MHNFNHTMYRHRTQIDRGHHIYFISFSSCVIQLNDAKRRWMRANRERRDKYWHSTALKRKSLEWKKVKSIFSRTYIGISTRSLRCESTKPKRISWTEKIEIPSVKCMSVLWVRLCVRVCPTEWIALHKCSAIAKRGNQDSNIRHWMRSADRIVSLFKWNEMLGKCVHSVRREKIRLCSPLLVFQWARPTHIARNTLIFISLSIFLSLHVSVRPVLASGSPTLRLSLPLSSLAQPQRYSLKSMAYINAVHAVIRSMFTRHSINEKCEALQNTYEFAITAQIHSETRLAVQRARR